MSAVPIDTIILYFPNETPVTAFHCDFKRIVRYKKLGEEKKREKRQKNRKKKKEKKKRHIQDSNHRVFLRRPVESSALTGGAIGADDKRWKC